MQLFPMGNLNAKQFDGVIKYVVFFTFKDQVFIRTRGCDSDILQLFYFALPGILHVKIQIIGVLLKQF